jgi:fructose-1,6-bisphosphatase
MSHSLKKFENILSTFKGITKKKDKKGKGEKVRHTIKMERRFYYFGLLEAHAIIQMVFFFSYAGAFVNTAHTYRFSPRKDEKGSPRDQETDVVEEGKRAIALFEYIPEQVYIQRFRSSSHRTCSSAFRFHSHKIIL